MDNKIIETKTIYKIFLGEIEIGTYKTKKQIDLAIKEIETKIRKQKAERAQNPIAHEIAEPNNYRVVEIVETTEKITRVKTKENNIAKFIESEDKFMAPMN